MIITEFALSGVDEDYSSDIVNYNVIKRIILCVGIVTLNVKIREKKKKELRERS